MPDEELEHLFRRAVQVTESLRQTQERLHDQAAERREVIASLRAAGVSYSTIADRLNCSRSAIQAILRS